MNHSDVIKDWEGVDFSEAHISLGDFWANGNYKRGPFLADFLHRVEQIRDKQIKEANRNVPALLRKEV